MLTGSITELCIFILALYELSIFESSSLHSDQLATEPTTENTQTNTQTEAKQIRARISYSTVSQEFHN